MPPGTSPILGEGPAAELSRSLGPGDLGPGPPSIRRRRFRRQSVAVTGSLVRKTQLVSVSLHLNGRREETRTVRDFELMSAADVLQAPSSLLLARLGLRGGTGATRDARRRQPVEERVK